MEASFIPSESNQRSGFSKKTVLIAALAITAVIGAIGTYNVNSTSFALDRISITNETTANDEVAAAGEFSKWTKNFKRNFGRDENKNRWGAWKANRDKVNRHNKKKTNYLLEVNDFADLTPEEFAAVHLGAKPRDDASKHQDAAHIETSFEATQASLSSAVDWRNTVRVGPVKSQGSCGSCWAFTAVAVLEGAYGKAANKAAVLSEQQLVDCANGQTYGSYGCDGGWPPQALKYSIEKGSASSASYPYTGKKGTCKTAASVYKPTRVVEVAKTVTGLKQAISVGPAAVYVQADSRNFQLYKSGVFDKVDCYVEGKGINHAVTAVGYDKDSFIIRNSWGSGWGEKGYIRISQSVASSAKGICGIVEWGAAYVV